MSLRAFAACCAIALLAASPSPGPTGAMAFAPPSGWTPMPAYFLPHAVTWKPIREGSSDRIIVERLGAGLPTGMMQHTFAMLPSLMRAFFGKMPQGLRYSSQSEPLCGAPGEIVTTTLPNAGARSQIVLENSGGSTYFFIYSFSGAPVEQHYIRALCPPSGSEPSSLRPPPQWASSQQFHAVAGWYGAELGETMMEMEGPPMPTLAAALALVRSSQRLFSSAGVQMSVENVVQTCGAHAIEQSIQTKTHVVASYTDVLVVQNDVASYALVYAGMHAPDATVLAALHGFCP